jgi:hypothetical protein
MQIQVFCLFAGSYHETEFFLLVNVQEIQWCFANVCILNILGFSCVICMIFHDFILFSTL